MFSRIVAGSLLAGLIAAASPAAAQDVTADVVFRSGPLAGRVIVGDRYSTYYRAPVVVHRRPVARRVVLVERYTPRVVVVERVYRHRSPRAWARLGYRPVTLYYIDGRYFDRRAEGWARAREVVVYERSGRFYSDQRDRPDDHDRHHRGHWDD